MTVQPKLRNETPKLEFVVVHPLYDEPEQKCDPSQLGPMKMSNSVRFSLIVLRGYLVLMGIMLAYHMFDVAGAFGHAGVK